MLRRPGLAIAILCLLVSFSAIAKVSVSQKGNLSVYEFGIEDVLTNKVDLNGKTYYRPTLKGIEGYDGILYKKGYSEIPVIRFFVNAVSEKDITISYAGVAKDRKSVGIDLQLMPSQQSLPKTRGAKRSFIQDANFYKINKYWPEKLYTIENAGTSNGMPRKLVTIYPFSYNPSVNAYKIKRDFVVEVVNNFSAKRSTSDKETFVFVIGEQFKDSPSLKNYMEFKASMGFDIAQIIVGEDATSEHEIRKALQELYATSNLKYAFIIGDLEDVPAKTAGHCKGVTDHYYRAIDTNDYEGDINGPDIGVGRLTVNNEAELSGALGKFIKYQRGLYGDEEWLNQIAFLATDDRWQVAEGTHNYAFDTYLIDKGYTGVFPQNPMAGGDKLYAITYKAPNETVNEVIKSGRFIVNYSGHGAKTYWDAPRVKQDNVRSLDHADANPFVISNACITGDFRERESFAETWIKHPQGAIMFWGSMDSSYWDEDDILEKRMYDGIYALGKSTFAEITQHALSEHWKHYGGANRSKYYWETYVTFGDPSIHLRNSRTVVPVIDGPTNMPIGIESVAFTLKNEEGELLPDTKMVIVGEDGRLLDYAYTDAEGQVTLKVGDAEVAEPLSIYAVGHNFRQEAFEFMLISANDPYLTMKDVTVNGDANRPLAPFEEVSLGFALKNVAQADTIGGEISIERIEGPAMLVSGEGTIPDIAAEETYLYSGDDLSFRVLDVQADATIVVYVKWKLFEGEEAVKPFTFKVNRANIAVTSIDFGNPENSFEGSLGAGDSGEIFFTVQNIGSAPISDATFQIAPTACLSSVANSFEIDSLLPGETIRVSTPIAVTIDPNCQTTDYASFAVEGSHQGAVAIERLAADGQFVVGRFGEATLAEENLNIAITDKQYSYYRFELPGIMLLKEITVSVDITHTYQGDLEITLISPDGKRTLLRPDSGGSTDDLHETYGVGGIHVPELEELYGMSSEGEWTLEVYDDASSDQGTLDAVSVRFFGYN